jgi:hypothetical protein
MTHFGAVFDTLDRLPLAQADRDALKVGFFGREIGDILGTPEGQRSERHESARQWQQRLQHTGFALCPAAAQPDPALAAAAAVHIRQHASHTSLDASDEPVVALFLARPRAPAAAH